MGGGAQIGVWIASAALIGLLGARTWPAGLLWSLTGTAVACAGWVAAIQGSDFARVARMGRLAVGDVLGSWVTALVTGGIMFILPSFLGCFAVARAYRSPLLVRGAACASLYSGAWHVAAHGLVVALAVREVHGRPVTGAMYFLLPLVIGLLWGLWLPSLA
jgi:hypothetical protein